MKPFAKRIIVSICGLAIVAFATRANAGVMLQTLPDYPVVTTLAGSGVAGIADGPGAQAQFMGPQGIAYDARGDLIVADTPAQRIRMVDPQGNVTTIAGSGAPTLFGSGVAAGYRDGAALQAQFNEPAAVAVGSDGTIYVADRGNHCIRAIKAGVVSTFAGDPQHPGATDGPRASATFSNPSGIAIDSTGALWVADPPGALRRIADGVVASVKRPEFDGAVGVSIYRDPTLEELYVATPHQVTGYNLHTNAVVEPFATDSLPAYDNAAHEIEREGAEFVGPAAAVAGLGAKEFVYADPLFSTIHLVQYSSTRVLGAQPLLDAGSMGGGFADGPGDRARYDQPLGIALSPSGAIAVADTGNKRIRVLSPFDRLTAANNPLVIPSEPYPSVTRIAIVGDSYIWTNVARSNSIGQIVFDRACATLRARGRGCNIEVYPVRIDGTSFSALTSYIDTYLAGGLVNDVYFLIPTYGHMGDPQTAAAALLPSYAASMTPALRDLQKTMTAAHARLVAVLVPGAWDVPNEMSYRKLFTGLRDPGQIRAQYERTSSAVRASGVPLLDLWAPFFASDAKIAHQNLFGAWDHHYTIAGNAMVGNAIAGDLVSTPGALP